MLNTYKVPNLLGVGAKMVQEGPEVSSRCPAGTTERSGRQPDLADAAGMAGGCRELFTQTPSPTGTAHC